MLMDDVGTSGPSSPEDSSGFDPNDLLQNASTDDVTAQLAAAGTVGLAAAAAVATGRKRRRAYGFETNPSVRKRQQTRLLRKLKYLLEEYTIRVGQQAIVLICSPGKANSQCKIFGASPLENVVRNMKSEIMCELESALAEATPAPMEQNPSLHELPPLIIDGIPTAIDKMTQAQLRNFIPMMLKYSTGRGKPGWGQLATRPPWWPLDVPWANVRSDVRAEDEKTRVSWTEALKTIVKNCYKFHCRTDLLYSFSDAQNKTSGLELQPLPTAAQLLHTANTAQVALAQGAMVPVQTIANPDGTISILQLDPSSGLISCNLADVSSSLFSQGDLQNNQTGETRTLHTMTNSRKGNNIISINPQNMLSVGGGEQTALPGIPEATLTESGHLMLTGSVAAAVSALATNSTSVAGAQTGGVLSLPVSMYQSFINSLMQQQSNVPTQQAAISILQQHLTTQQQNTGVVSNGGVVRSDAVEQAMLAETRQSLLQSLNVDGAADMINTKEKSGGAYQTGETLQNSETIEQ